MLNINSLRIAPLEWQVCSLGNILVKEYTTNKTNLGFVGLGVGILGEWYCFLYFLYVH